MGTQFFWVYDIIFAAVAIGIIFKCWKSGFVAALLGFVSVFVAFFGALWLSDGISSWAYTKFIEAPVEQQIDEQVTQYLGDNIIVDLQKVDTSKITVNGKSLDELNLTPDSAGKATLDLSKVDFSQTGIDKVDLSSFGITDEINISALKVGTVQFTQSELENNDLGKLIFARTLASTAENGTVYGMFTDVAESFTNALPRALGQFSESVESGDNTAISDIALALLNVNTDVGSSITDCIVKPIVMIPLRALIFAILFAIIIIILSIIIRATKVINKIPVLGTVNGLLGGVLGVVEAFIVICIICIIVQVIIALTNNELIFLNTMTIDKSFAFKYFYNFEFLDFLN